MLNDESQRLIREHLEQLFRSKPFSKSPSQQRFLEYTIKKTLAGEEADLKEYTIAVEAFSKPSSFDSEDHSIVRTTVSRLRISLKAYYESEGHDSLVVISYPLGSYIPC